MNNEPVAWIDPFDLERLPLYDSWVSGEKTKWADIPLYTHPTDLTDEEINEVINKRILSEEIRPALIDFARAILKKASEK